MARRRVVITGLGPVTAFGVGIELLWQAMIEGRSAIKRIERFNPCGFPCKIAAELSDDEFSVRKIVPKSHRKAIKVMCRDTELAVAASIAAVADAGLVTPAIDPQAKPTIDPPRLGCQVGAGLIAADVDELTAALVTSRDDSGEFDLRHWGESGMENLTPLWLLKYLPNMLASHVTIIHDCQGPSNSITCCEASSGLSIGESMRVIQRGAADACLSGGVESKINPMAFLRQHFTDRLATTREDEDPATVVSPFDANARGTVLGEGGGLIVLEALESSEARGAEPYAELVGFASTQSYDPDADSDGITDAMQLALQRAEVQPSQVDAIAPFGSGIPEVDGAEATAIKNLLGTRASQTPLITTIPNVGNCNAGSGAVSVAVAAQAIKAKTLPARLNTTSADGLDAGACPSRSFELKHVLVSCTSQGGQNVAMVLRSMD